MIKNDNPLANDILDYLTTQTYWTRSQEIRDYLKSVGRNRDRIINVLLRLRDVGTVTVRGTGRYQWKIATTSWDRNDPLGLKSKPVPVPAPTATPSQSDGDLALLQAKVEELDSVVQSFEDRVALVETGSGGGAKTIDITIDQRPLTKLDEVAHPQLEKVLKLVSARINVLLVGPAGCGKSYLAGQVARSLTMPFGHISCSAGMSEGHLLGRLLPTGKSGTFEYSPAPFVERYEEGGVFLLDEVDAADANTVIILNTALANGSLSVPNRHHQPEAKRHRDFVCLAAANTFGTGADRQYVGRNQLDEAFLDRFRMGQVQMGYDPALEAHLCPDSTLRTRLLSYRKRAEESKLRRVVSTRFLKDAYTALQAGLAQADVDRALFAGWSQDEVQKVRGT